MFSEAKFRYDLWKIQREQKRSAAQYNKRIKLARKQNKSEEVSGIGFERFEVSQFYDDRIALLQSQFLTRQAQDYLLPIPEIDKKSGAWEESKYSFQWCLTVSERAKLRSAIRIEKRERWEHWERWVVLVIGLIGALTGLVAMWKP